MEPFNTGNICCIFNLAAHYRAPIYKSMDEYLQCDFYITTWKVSPFKQMDYEDLQGFKSTFKYIPIFKHFYWQKGAIQLAFKPYKHYIITGEPYCISTWMILIFTKILGKKTHLWTHGWYGDESNTKKVIKKVFFSLSSTVLLYGNYARNLMIKEGIPSNKLVCIYNSLNYDLQLKVRNQLKESKIYRNHFKNDLPTLIYIGRIQKVKKIELLFEAQSMLINSGTFFNVVLVGKESNDSKYLNNIIANYKLENNVWFFGECYDENIIGELIYNSNVCVSPGNVGLTAMHSLVYGTPVITHNNFSNQMPEFESIKEGETGDFFEENNANDLSEKIKPWISINAKKKEILREKCYKIIDERYNPHKQIETFIKLLK